MPKVSSLAACISLAAALTLVAASPAPAQTVSDNETKLPPAAAPQAPNEAQPAEAQPAPVTPAEAQPVPAVVEIDPLLAQVRQQLAALKGGGIPAADRAALVAFYTERTGAIWVTADGFTARARDTMQEIAKADDWGLSAKAFALPAADLADRSLPALASAEIKLSLAVLLYARHARGGRLEPLQVSRNFDQKPPLRDAKQVLEAVAATDAPGGYLRDLHPKHPQFQLLRQALLKVRAGSGEDRQADKAEKPVRMPEGPTLRLGMEHPDVRLLRRRLKLPEAPLGAAELYDREVQQAVAAFQRKTGINASGDLTARTRSALNSAESPQPAAFGTEEQRLLVNMERWRWMPEDLGEFHVWDNIPEFQMRVMKRGQMVHQAKIIVGKPETQTAIFSASMKYVIFGPEWGVPDSIKIKEILPYLRPSYETNFFGFGGTVTDTRILEKHNLRVTFNGRPVDASTVDWSSVDIRKFSFIQPAGRGNVLGAVKFRFPNKHDIYMHDTPQRELFDKTLRTYSHGCIRVHNPGRLAEVLLEEDKGWSAARVRELMAQGIEGISHEATLTKQIPVHITYFTAVAGEDGQVRYFGDVYGHDRRVTAALAGRPMPLEPPSVSAPTASGKQDAKEARGKKRPYAQNTNDIFTGLFGN